ncbi:hypothetical protein ACHAXR_003828 [Thalassiosira sp. AJA248-18]
MPNEVLNNSQWLSKFSDDFKDDLSKLMIPFNGPEGHVFVREDDPIESFLIVESGNLLRTKRPSGEGNKDDQPIKIDTVGPGRISGFLHVAGHPDEDVAFATITAGKGGAKVWVVSGRHFRKMCEVNPKHSSEVIKVLTLVLRYTTKIVRATVAGNPSDVHDEAVDTKNKKVLKVMCYDTTSWVKENFEPQVKSFNENGEDLKVMMDYTQDRLDVKTAKFAAGYDAVCLFVNDTADAETLWVLSMCGVKMIVMRCAGFDRVDVKTAKTFGMSVARVPAYSPYAVAEHAIALLMSVNRRITAASTRVKMANFSLDSSLLGMDIHGKKVGVMGTGKIGQILCRIIAGFGVDLLAFDVYESHDVKEMGGKYVSQEEIYKTCDVIFLMMPLLPATKHTINPEVLPLLKKGVILINTSRGGLIDTSALVTGLQSGIIGGCGLDVYENEAEYFFQDWSGKAIEDNVLATLMGNNRVVMTAHQAFFTREAIDKIVSTTIENLSNYSSGLRGKELPNSI